MSAALSFSLTPLQMQVLEAISSAMEYAHLEGVPYCMDYMIAAEGRKMFGYTWTPGQPRQRQNEEVVYVYPVMNRAIGTLRTTGLVVRDEEMVPGRWQLTLLAYDLLGLSPT